MCARTENGASLQQLSVCEAQASRSRGAARIFDAAGWNWEPDGRAVTIFTDSRPFASFSLAVGLGLLNCAE